MSKPTTSEPAERSTLRAVAVPSEHGGWGLTLEPGILGLLVAPSTAGASLATAALFAFLARTPLKLALVDRRRRRRLDRTRVATRVAVIEISVIAGLVLLTAATAANPWWWVALAAAAPLFAVELWYDIRSRGRRLVPELCGAIAVASVAAAIVIAADDRWQLAVGLWIVVAARVATSIPHVRGLIMRLHGRRPPAAATVIGDLAALTGAVVVWMLDAGLRAGSIALIGVVAFQRSIERGAPRPATTIGVHQTVLGFVVVLATALGTWVT